MSSLTEQSDITARSASRELCSVYVVCCVCGVADKVLSIVLVTDISTREPATYMCS